MTRWACC